MTNRIIIGDGPEALAREGLALEPAAWEDGLRADTGPGNFEWWYFDAHLDDRSSVALTLLTKPLLHRTDPLSPSVRLAITRPDGEQLLGVGVYAPHEFSASREHCDVRVGPSWARGDLRRYELHVEADELAADLAFTGIAPPWRPGAGIDYFDEARTRYFGWFPSMPFGHVEGTLTYDGETHTVTGSGYHDHNWGNLDLNAGLSHWFWGRAHVGDYSTIFVQMTATKKYGSEALPVFMLARKDEILTDVGQALTLRMGDPAKHASGKTYPRKLNFHWEQDGHTVDLEIRKPRIIEATSLLTYLPTWKRLLGRVFANPYYFRFEGDLHMTINLPRVQADVEGQALYELMILH